MHDLNMLLRKLRKAFRLSHHDKTIALQDRYAAALCHVADFLEPADEKIANQFLVLASEIEELRYGIVTRALRPAKVGGRGPDGVGTWIFRVDVVIGLECILKSQKMKKRDAANYIAKKYPVFDQIKRNPDALLASSILSWRDRIKAGKVSEGLASLRSFFRQHNSDDLAPGQMFARGEELLAETAKQIKASF
jgi:hypothetical protein